MMSDEIDLMDMAHALAVALRERDEYGIGLAEHVHANMQLRAELDKFRAKLDDDDLVERVVRAACHDEGHHPAWCSHCESMDMGIEAYRAELRKEMGHEQGH